MTHERRRKEVSKVDNFRGLNIYVPSEPEDVNVTPKSGTIKRMSLSGAGGDEASEVQTKGVAGVSKLKLGGETDER